MYYSCCKTCFWVFFTFTEVNLKPVHKASFGLKEPITLTPTWWVCFSCSSKLRCNLWGTIVPSIEISLDSMYSLWTFLLKYYCEEFLDSVDFIISFHSWDYYFIVICQVEIMPNLKKKLVFFMIFAMLSTWISSSESQYISNCGSLRVSHNNKNANKCSYFTFCHRVPFCALVIWVWRYLPFLIRFRNNHLPHFIIK